MTPGPYSPDTRIGRIGAIRRVGSTSDIGTALSLGDTSEQMAEALNRAYQLGRLSAQKEIRIALGIEQ